MWILTFIPIALLKMVVLHLKTVESSGSPFMVPGRSCWYYWAPIKVPRYSWHKRRRVSEVLPFKLRSGLEYQNSTQNTSSKMPWVSTLNCPLCWRQYKRQFHQYLNTSKFSSVMGHISQAAHCVRDKLPLMGKICQMTGSGIRPATQRDTHLCYGFLSWHLKLICYWVIDFNQIAVA